MNLALALKAALLGLIEGLTEFLPVSSTGHLILAGHYLGFESPGNSFEVLIQLGAILAILSVYFGKLWFLAKGMFSDRKSQMFILAVLLAFMPAVVIGIFAHSAIKSVLFTPFVVCISLISGGLVLLVVDETQFDTKIHDVMDIPLVTALKIGFFQCLAMIPGVSRSGATIVGGMLMGTDKRTAAEFSFFLAMPTMVGAFSYDLYKNYKLLAFNDVAAIGIGFVVAFAAGLFVVRGFLDFISLRGFAPFAWWRIIVGCFGLAAWFVYG
ncbi:MAG: undecaprenyl-diphosphatase [Rhizobiales bacterium PAR1]|nr:MAG: undecaprenyl-diphosphatase [Rhizobiales bacterium PAR1]